MCRYAAKSVCRMLANSTDDDLVKECTLALLRREKEGAQQTDLPPLVATVQLQNPVSNTTCFFLYVIISFLLLLLKIKIC